MSAGIVNALAQVVNADAEPVGIKREVPLLGSACGNQRKKLPQQLFLAGYMPLGGGSELSRGHSGAILHDGIHEGADHLFPEGIAEGKGPQDMIKLLKVIGVLPLQLYQICADGLQPVLSGESQDVAAKIGGHGLDPEQRPFGKEHGAGSGHFIPREIQPPGGASADDDGDAVLPQAGRDPEQPQYIPHDAAVGIHLDGEIIPGKEAPSGSSALKARADLGNRKLMNGGFHKTKISEVFEKSIRIGDIINKG